MNSLRRTLLLSLLGAIIAVLALAGLATYSMARNEADELMDYHLRQFALSLHNQHFVQPPDAAPLEPPQDAFDFVIQIWDEHGVRLYLSHPHSTLPTLAQLGYTTVETPEGRWRVFSIPLQDQVIQIAQPMAVRSRMAANAALRTLIPFLAAIPLLGVLIWYLVGRGLGPINRLARDVARRRTDSLDPLPEAHIPEEVRPLVLALNHLLGRLHQALSAQRAFVADAAHELRTPLSALQIQLQLTERAPNEASRQAALGELQAGLDRATHLVQQLLTLARQEPGSGHMTTPVPVPLAKVARQCLTDFAPLAQARQIDLGADQLDDTLTVGGDPSALRTLINNLLDNAIRYTPGGGRVDLGISREGPDGEAPADCWLRVHDNGPGIPPEDRERVLDRFYRRPGVAQTGSGLGLAIVQRITASHRARLILGTSPLGGLEVAVGFTTALSPADGPAGIPDPHRAATA